MTGEIENKIYNFVEQIFFFRDLAKEEIVSDFKDDINAIEKELSDALMRNIGLVKGSVKVEVAVIGDFSSGKSTFINSFLGESVCPMDVNPTTSSITKFYFSPKEEIYINGKSSSREEYINIVKHSKENKTNQKTYMVEYGFPSRIFSSINLYDSPGFNNPKNKNDEIETQKLLEQVDVVLYIIDINKGGVTKKELEKLKKLKSEGKMLFGILNKSDKKSSQSVEKIRHEIINYFVFDSVIDYSSLKVLNSMLNDELKDLFEDIYKNKVTKEKEFELSVKGEFIKGRRGKIYKVIADEKEIKVPDIKYLQKRDEIISILNGIALQKKPLIENLLKNKEKEIKEKTYQLLKTIVEKLKNRLERLNDNYEMNGLDNIMDYIFQSIEDYEKYQIGKKLQILIVESFKKCLVPKAASQDEKPYILWPDYKIEFDRFKFSYYCENAFFLNKENYETIIDKYVNYVEKEINPPLEKKISFSLRVKKEDFLLNNIAKEVLGDWHEKLGKYLEDEGGAVRYFNNESDANEAIESLKKEIDKIFDHNPPLALTQIVKRINESGIEQKKQELKEQDKSHSKRIELLINKIENYLEGVLVDTKIEDEKAENAMILEHTI